MMASHTNGIHRTRSHRLRVLHSGCRQASWAMMTRQARRSSAIQHDTVRCGFLSRRSYVAPSRRSRGSAKRPRKELTYCPIYGFKPCVICAKDLTPALFCLRGQKPPITASLMTLLTPSTARGKSGVMVLSGSLRGSRKTWQAAACRQPPPAPPPCGGVTAALCAACPGERAPLGSDPQRKPP